MNKKLQDTNLDCLMFTVVSYKNLWEDVIEKGLVTLNESEDEVIDNKTTELKKYLEENGVKFDKKVDPTSDDMSYEYFADFYIDDKEFITDYFKTMEERDNKVMEVCLDDYLYFEGIGKNEYGYWVKYFSMSVWREK